MGRLPRYEVPGVPQHVIQRGNNRQPIFADDGDYRAYLGWLGLAAAEHGVAIHAYVLMTNHVHLLVTPNTAGGIGRTLQSLGRRYVQYFNRSYGRTGTLWEGRYRSTVIDAERYFLTCSRYIESNPVRAGMVTAPEQYPWSSFRHNGLAVGDDLITAHALYEALGSDVVTRCTAYRALFAAALGSDETDAIRSATNAGWVLGNDRFRSEIESLAKRRGRPLARGRKCGASTQVNSRSS